MWQRLNNWKNWYRGLAAYSAMSPDLQVRRRVRQKLDQRPHLSESEWLAQYCEPVGIAAPIATFAYHQLQRYSGLEIGRIKLDDRLEADLHWSQICWFDWTFTLCQDFWHSFAIDLEEPMHAAEFETIGDLIALLNQFWTAETQQQAKALDQEQPEASSVQEVSVDCK